MLKLIPMKYLIIIFILTHLYSPKKDTINNYDSFFFEKLWQGILITESSNKHFTNWRIVESKKGALGIAQIMPETFSMIKRMTGEKNLNISNRIHNLKVGKYYFSNSYYNVYKNSVLKAISSYNMGWSNKKINTNYYLKVLSNSGLI